MIVILVWLAIAALCLLAQWYTGVPGEDRGSCVFAFVPLIQLAWLASVLMTHADPLETERRRQRNATLRRWFRPSVRRAEQLDRDYQDVLALIEWRPKPESYWAVKELEWELSDPERELKRRSA